jgi:hypothetical protein
MDVVAYLVPFLAFLGLYAVLHRRQKQKGQNPAIQWGWLVAIFACAAAAVVLGNAL